MQDTRAFCRAVMHEYERQWSHASGHAVRHPLRLKMERLAEWCTTSCVATEFEARLVEAERSDDIGLALLAEELLPLWRAVTPGGDPPQSGA
ncbi:MAG TPA: hypothetical protein VGQ62_12315 [Chloroflexota bacterium]|jgi:hypothetical protein|nr:hypothetical protein [Chloroflexota bacterium]